MKKTFIKMLPLVAAVLLATSCSKDSNDDSNVVIDNPTDNTPAQEVVVDNQVKMVPFSITVNKNTLSKASLESESSLQQVFEDGDQLVIRDKSTHATLVTLELTEGAGQSSATFSKDIEEGTLTDGTPYDVVLTSTAHTECGTELTEVKTCTSMQQAFQDYGYLTSELTYGETTSIQLVQNTVFVKVNLPFHGAKVTFTIDETVTVKYLYGDEIFAIPNGTKIESALLDIDKTVDLSDNKVVLNIKNRTTPDDCINGVFSVAADKQVFFSKGNLQYNVNDERFLLATHQWDFVGGMWNGSYYGTLNGNDNSNAQGPLVDLFGWGMWLDEITTKEDVLKNTQSSSDYSPTVTDGQFADNQTTIEGTTWFTMSNAEWEYLFNTRENHSLYGKGTVNGISGLIVLPDKWIQPDGVSSLVTGATSTTYISNNYDAEAWGKMEANGALFLPAARRRNGATFDAEYNLAHYWTSSTSSSDNSGFLYFIDNGGINKFEVNYIFRHRGQSVRLVRTLQ